MRIFNKINRAFEQQQSINHTGLSMTKNNTFEKYAYIDWRFDQPNDVTLLGHRVNSFANTRLVVNQIKNDGFNGIVLNTNVPIDPETGELTLIDKRPGAFNTNKNIPKDTWAVVQYAKKLGLDVTLNFNIVDYKTDTGITSSSVGPNFSTEKFFNAVTSYESKIAALASRYKVNTIGIGDHQFGFDTDQYRPQWQNLVNQVRSKFKGDLSYSSGTGGDNVVYGMVDIINVNRGPETLDKNVALNHINELYRKYNKPVQLSPIFASAADSGIDPWSMLMNNQSLNDVNIRYDLQADKIRDILKASIINTPESLAGIAFYEYAPWQQANWIQNPQDDQQRQWHLNTKLSSEFFKNQTASDTFKNWFNYSTQDVSGTRKNDTLRVYAGDKTIDGKEGRDTVVISNSIKNCRITKDTANGGFDVYNGANGVDGVYDMYNVEFVKFNDATVNLLGNDLSKYSWF